MATKDLSSSDIKTQEELEEITTCCICTDVYTDPKALPCIHIFCMKCLQETGIQSNKGPGDEMPCPICRRLFKIPSEGFPGLSKNFFIERLIQVSRPTDPSEVAKALHVCSLCLEESKEQEGKETPTAHICCVVCKTNLCEECCNEHRKLKATKNHKLMPINEYESDQNVKSDLAAMVCEVHAQRFVDVYCADCKTVVCAICFIEEHNSHKGSHVNKCVDGYRKQIENNKETMNGCVAQAQMKKAELVMVKEQMQKRAGSLESDIDNRKRQIRQFADKHASSLFQDLCCERQSRLKEIQMTTDDIDAYLSNLESYNSYCQRIMAKGSASDICSAHSDLSIRAFELHQQCQPIIERGIEEFKFCFRRSELEEFLDEDGGNLVGGFEKEGELKPKKTSKKFLLEEQRKEIDILRQKSEQLSEWRANYNAHMEKLKQDLENNQTAFSTLQVSNDKLKQELDVEKTTSNSPQTSNDKKKYGDYTAYIEKLKQDLEKNKTEFNALQVGNDKLKQELDAEKPIMKTLEANAEKLISELQYRSRE